MNFVEYQIGADTKASVQEETGILRCFRSPSLSDIIEAIWDCDIPDENFARSLTLTCAPGTCLQLIGQYRRPAEIHQRTKFLPAKCAIHIRSHALTLRPTGALGNPGPSNRRSASTTEAREVFSPQRHLRPKNEFLTEVSDNEDYCLMRCTLPAGAVVPMHSHADRETFYVLSGKPHVLREGRWEELGPGDVFDVRDGAKHAWRNLSQQRFR